MPDIQINDPVTQANQPIQVAVVTQNTQQLLLGHGTGPSVLRTVVTILQCLIRIHMVASPVIGQIAVGVDDNEFVDLLLGSTL